jgi:hypothetical protein
MTVSTLVVVASGVLTDVVAELHRLRQSVA